jgi:hypothetical protein
MGTPRKHGRRFKINPHQLHHQRLFVMNSLFSFLFLKRICIAFFITRRAFRRPTPLVPRGVMPPTIPAIF